MKINSIYIYIAFLTIFFSCSQQGAAFADCVPRTWQETTEAARFLFLLSGSQVVFLMLRCQDDPIKIRYSLQS